MGWIFWTILFLVIHSVLVVPCLMALALDKPARDESGCLRVKTKGFVIRTFFGFNAWRLWDMNKTPKNLCLFYYGIWWGCFSGLGMRLVFGVVAIIAFVFGYLILAPILFLCGRLPKCALLKWHRYERYGKRDEKRWIAPWKFLLPLGIVCSIWLYPDVWWSVMTEAYQDMGIRIFAGLLGCIVVAVVVVCGIIFLVEKAGKTRLGAIVKEGIKSIKDRYCLKVVASDEQDEQE